MCYFQFCHIWYFVSHTPNLPHFYNRFNTDTFCMWKCNQMSSDRIHFNILQLTETFRMSTCCEMSSDIILVFHSNWHRKKLVSVTLAYPAINSESKIQILLLDISFILSHLICSVTYTLHIRQTDSIFMIDLIFDTLQMSSDEMFVFNNLSWHRT